MSSKVRCKHLNGTFGSLREQHQWQQIRVQFLKEHFASLLHLLFQKLVEEAERKGE